MISSIILITMSSLMLVTQSEICPTVCNRCHNSTVTCDFQRIEIIPRTESFNVSTKHLNLAGNLIQSITKASLPDLPDLEVLDLSHNWIISIEDGAFSKYPKLIDLNLAKNLIKRISNKTFDGLPSLDKLNLSDQILNGGSLCIDDYAFANNRKLEWLFARGNNLKQITTYTFSGTNLEQLSLESQDIRKFLPGAFDSVKPNAYVYFQRITTRLCCCESLRAVLNNSWPFDCVKNEVIYKIRDTSCINDSYCQETDTSTTCTLEYFSDSINPSPSLPMPSQSHSSMILGASIIKGRSGKDFEQEDELKCDIDVYTIVFGSLGMTWLIVMVVVGYLVWRQRYHQQPGRETTEPDEGANYYDWR